MPAQTPCQVPTIDHALSSYINSRDDTLAIRRTLSKYLTAGLRPVQTATQHQHLNHECPHGLTAVVTDPPGLRGTRSSYLEALRARNVAQNRHRELQASLEELRAHHIIEAPAQTELQSDSEATRSYISLIRQRRRLAELQVVQDTLGKLLDAHPTKGPLEPRTLIKNAVGEQPGLPADQLEKSLRSDDNDTLAIQLKKEVLEARSSMAHAHSARLEAQGASRGAPNLDEQVYALGRAREEIVEWMQEELAKMEEVSQFVDGASPVKRSTGSPSTVDLASAEIQIRGFYERYTASRSAAIRSQNSVDQDSTSGAAKLDQSSSYIDTNEERRESKRYDMVATKLLPYLPTLSRTDGNERSLLQQAIYLQFQVTSANEEIADSLLRLSGESHLLPSGTKDVGSWGTTATEAEALNQAFTKGQLQDSREELAAITTIVDVCSLQGRILSSG